MSSASQRRCEMGEEMFVMTTERSKRRRLRRGRPLSGGVAGQTEEPLADHISLYFARASGNRQTAIPEE